MALTPLYVEPRQPGDERVLDDARRDETRHYPGNASIVMRLSAQEDLDLQQTAVAMTKLRPVADVARDLGIRTEVELPRLPGVVAWARTLADGLGLTATVELRAERICVRFTP